MPEVHGNPLNDQRVADMKARRLAREAERKAAEERYDNMVSQIARVLANNKATVSELPSIWKGVYNRLTVQVSDS